MTNRHFVGKILGAAAVFLSGLAALSAQDSAQIDGSMQVRAQVRPTLQTTLSSELSSQVIRLPFDAGDSFKKGQVIAAFNCSILEAELQKAEAANESAIAKHTSVKRLQELSSASVLEVQMAESEKKMAAADVKIVKENIKHCNVLAPFNGRVMERYVNPFQFVKGGDPMLKIYATGAIEIDFLTPSSALKWLKIGTALKMDVEETGETLNAKVSKVGSFVDPVSQTIQVRATITDQDTRLLPGMSGIVRFE